MDSTTGCFNEPLDLYCSVDPCIYYQYLALHGKVECRLLMATSNRYILADIYTGAKFVVLLFQNMLFILPIGYPLGSAVIFASCFQVHL